MQTPPSPAWQQPGYQSWAGTQAALDYGALPPEVAANLNPETGTMQNGSLRSSTPLANKTVFVTTAATVLFCLLFLEVWDGMRLLLNGDIRFWAGTGPAVAIIAISVVIFASYLLVSGQSRSPAPTAQNMCIVFAMHLMLLGVGLVLATMPLQQRAMVVKNSILLDCAYTQPAQGLKQEYSSLLKLRLQPDCMKQSSVKLCDGYQKTPHTPYLQAMEQKFQCSGFCLGSGSYLQSHTSNVTYPPLLFSSAASKPTLQTSCDTMIAVELTEVVDKLARQNWYVGTVLLIISLGIGLSYWSSPPSKIV
jgi:hypothetical protein